MESIKKEYLHQKYVTEVLDENGMLRDIKFTIPENFNFGFDVVDAIAEKDNEKPALVWEGNNHDVKKFTFKDISELSNKAANYFLSLGIKKGDRVLMIMKRHYQFWYTITALHKIGAVAIPATYLLTEEDIEYRLKKAGVKYIICTSDGEISDAADGAIEASGCVDKKLMVNGAKDGWIDFDAGVAEQSSVFERPTGENATKATDAMLMYFTSGTTAYPKIVTHDYTYPIGHIVTAKWWQNVHDDGLHFTISDTGWAKAAWGKIYGQWLCEAAVFVYDFDKFNAHDILQMFAKHKITTFCAPPTMYRMFIKENLDNYDLSSLEYACIAGEALNPEVYYQFQKSTGLKLMEGFGQTETTVVVANLTGAEPKAGSMGKPNPQYEIELVNKNGEPVKNGESGELCIRTDKSKPCGLFNGYYLDEEQTKQAWHDGLYHTGDMAKRDEDGYFWYIGRIDDVIKSSGYRISPFEVESTLMEIPYILECAITGVPDAIRGQVIKASIVLVKGKEASEDLKKEIQTYVKKHTAPYKYPRIVEFMDELPKTVSGKIRRVELREQK